MARGRTSRSYYKQKKAEVKAELTAKTEYAAKLFKNKKITQKWLIEQLEKHTDKIPKYAAIAGLTVLVKSTIDASEDLMSRAAVPMLALSAISPIMIPFMPAALMGTISAEEFKKIPDWAEWIVSFTIAYILIEHGGSIIGLLGSGSGGLSSIISLLLPAV